MKKILIYQDEGVSSNSFQRLLGACLELLPDYTIHPINHRSFHLHGWESTTALLIFPGGRDQAYHNQLKGEANARIRGYVNQGGRFLGICAGGYYGAREIEFEKGGKLEICAQRELGFFPGKAIGPAYGNGYFHYDSEFGARSAQISWENRTSSLYFNGGCFFHDADSHPSTQVLAQYQDLPDNLAACVLCSFGKGYALLSGIHPEYTPQDPFFKYLLYKILT